MNFSSKFDMGQFVTHITRQWVDLSPVTCAACEGSKKVDLRGSQFDCPGCKGAGTVLAKAYGWVLGVTSSVGSIEAKREVVTEMTCFYNGEEELDEGTERTLVKYMLRATGVGGGSVYDEHCLFASREEAQAECDRRNDFVRAVGS